MAYKPREEDAVVQKLIGQLNFIASITPGNRIDVAAQCIQPNTFISRATRALFARGESRSTALDYIQKTIESAMKLSFMDQDTAELADDARLRQILISHIKLALAGLSNLTETYKDDHMFVAQSGALIELTQMKLKEIERQ